MNEKIFENDESRPTNCRKSSSTDSSLSNEIINDVLEHSSPPEATVPNEQKMEIIEMGSVQEPSSSSEAASSSWIHRVKTVGLNWIKSSPPSSSESRNVEESNNGKKAWKTKLSTTWNNLKYSSRWMTDRSDEYYENDNVILLGKYYSTNREEFHLFCSDYYSRIWITYRTNFPPILNTDVTTDCGWGCMIRTTQMMIAQAVVVNRLTRSWRFKKRSKMMEELKDDRQKWEELKILKLFEDNETAALGIHRLISIASRDRGLKSVGSWYTPSEAAHIMKQAISESTSPLISDLALCISIDGKIHIRDVEVETKNWSKKLIMIVICRLGSSDLNPIYKNHLKFLFTISSFLGITGGKPDHSLYFIGNYEDEIIYLDPHVAHEYVKINDDIEMLDDFEHLDNRKKGKKSAEKSYHCKLLSKMEIEKIDPSCALCFQFENREEFDKVMKELNLRQFIDIDKGEEIGMKRVENPMFLIIYGERKTFENYEESASETDKEQANKHGFEIL